MGNNISLNSERINKLLLWKWLLIGLFIRLLLMPFTFHGNDIFLNYYSPYMFLSKGAFDPYLYLSQHFPNIGTSYYPPLLYYFFSASLCLLKFMLPFLDKMYSFLEPNLFIYSFNTVHFADFLSSFGLFRTLFIFKIPYLVCDFSVAGIILLILKTERKEMLVALKTWMLNPFVLHTCYLVGQSDIIPLFFIMFATIFIYRKSNYTAVILLCLATATKGYPIFLLPAFIVLAGDTLLDKIKLSAVSLLAFFAIAAPFYFSSGFAFLGSFNAYYAFPALRKILFIATYLASLLFLFFCKKNRRADLYFIISVFTSVLLLFYVFYSVTLRHFVSVTPFLIFLTVKNKNFWVYNILFLVSLFYLRTAGNTQQWGLFAPLHPEFFSSLPIGDSFINLIFNVKYLHQFAFRVFVLTAIAMIGHLFFLNRDNFKLGSRYAKEKNY